jgi:hypothetical protein
MFKKKTRIGHIILEELNSLQVKDENDFSFAKIKINKLKKSF